MSTDQNTTTTTPHINQVRSTLMETLQHLGKIGRTPDDGKPLDLEQIKAQVQVANAMKGIADTLVDTARVEADYIKASGAPSSNFLETPPEVDKLPPPSTTPTPHNPFPVSRRHTLEG